MTHWLLSEIEEKRKNSLALADLLQVKKELLKDTSLTTNLDLLKEVAETLVVAILDLLLEEQAEDKQHSKLIQSCAKGTFRLMRAYNQPNESLEARKALLLQSSLAVIGDCGQDAVRILKTVDLTTHTKDHTQWSDRTWALVIELWLRLIRKQGWKDRDLVLEGIQKLRTEQNDFEKNYLHNLEPLAAKPAALELIILYHLAKAAEILALFITDGVVEKNYQIQKLIDSQFDRIQAICEVTPMLELQPLAIILKATAAQLIRNSIWTVSRAVNSRVTKFVQTLVDKGRGDKALFDVLPPQRRALAEKGLLGSSRRAVVVSLPTSSGKTLIAQFRILQALNQFDHEEGWVAYLAPTRALVQQVTRQLRQDFAPLGIVVERISPAMEIDSVEMNLFLEQNGQQKFRILVSTPEKLDLMLRQGWEAKISRPLTLVVVDEAHNIQDSSRGLKLELLLATINKECKHAQFLLLTPFISNAREIARWLDETSFDDISLALDWQPNDRIIGTVTPIKDNPLCKTKCSFHLSFESVHTTRNTISLEEKLTFATPAEMHHSQCKKRAQVAALTVEYLKERGPVILIQGAPNLVWSTANIFKSPMNLLTEIHEDIKLTQEYLKLELGKDFPLIDLLNHGIGIHHGGLPDEVKSLMEWLFTNNHLQVLVATTTIAQGINFPVSAVVMAANDYPAKNHSTPMPAEDFWNIAGRAGRVHQGQLGVVALAATNPEQAEKLKEFIHRQTGALNSALIKMAIEAQEQIEDLGGIVYKLPEWSSFLQYLAHTYQQMGKPQSFFQQIEQVLRGTLGFEKLRTHNKQAAKKLLVGIEKYIEYLQQPNQPLKLVDSTGFSLQSIKTVLTHKGNINETSWDKQQLFSQNDPTLKEMMGILLKVPELRDNLQAVIGNNNPDGDILARIIKDWVHGRSIEEIATSYFGKQGISKAESITKCGQNLFGKITQTTSWGLGALLTITAGSLDDDRFLQVRNLPSQVFYGVNSDEAVTLRLLGIPRAAAPKLATHLQKNLNQSLPAIRQHLATMDEQDWKTALGDSGNTYRKVWKILEC